MTDADQTGQGWVEVGQTRQGLPHAEGRREASCGGTRSRLPGTETQAEGALMLVIAWWCAQAAIMLAAAMIVVALAVLFLLALREFFDILRGSYHNAKPRGR